MKTVKVKEITRNLIIDEINKTVGIGENDTKPMRADNLNIGSYFLGITTGYRRTDLYTIQLVK